LSPGKHPSLKSLNTAQGKRAYAQYFATLLVPF
jgi:hypothetical protein